MVKAINGWLAVAWIALVPVLVLTDAKRSVSFIAFAMAWQAAWGHYNVWLTVDVAPGEP